MEGVDCDHLIGLLYDYGSVPINASTVPIFARTMIQKALVSTDEHRRYTPWPYCPLCGRPNDDEFQR